jgi:hypothetical protein
MIQKKTKEPKAPKAPKAPKDSRDIIRRVYDRTPSKSSLEAAEDDPIAALHEQLDAFRAQYPNSAVCVEPKDVDVVFDKTGSMGVGSIHVIHNTPPKHPSKYWSEGDLSFEIIGMRGSGKSTILREIIPQIGSLSEVIIFTLIPNNPVNIGIHKWCEAQKPQIYYGQYDAPTPETIDEVQEILAAKPQGTNAFFVFDDFCPSDGSLTNPYVAFSVECFRMLRNMGCFCCFITQSATGVNTKIRVNSSIKIVYRMPDIYAMRSIIEDFAASGLCTKDEITEIFKKYIMKEDHAYIMLVQAGSTNKLYICGPKLTGGVLQELVVSSTEPITEDSCVKTLLEKIHNDSISFYERAKTKKELQRYVHQIADETDASYDDLMSQLDDQ